MKSRAERLDAHEDNAAKATKAILNLRTRRMMIVTKMAANQGLGGGALGDRMTDLAQELYYLDHAIASLERPDA